MHPNQLPPLPHHLPTPLVVSPQLLNHLHELHHCHSAASALGAEMSSNLPSVTSVIALMEILPAKAFFSWAAQSFTNSLLWAPETHLSPQPAYPMTQNKMLEALILLPPISKLINICMQKKIDSSRRECCGHPNRMHKYQCRGSRKCCHCGAGNKDHASKAGIWYNLPAKSVH